MGAGASAAPPSLRSLTSRKGSRVPKQWWIESEKCIISDAFLIISTLSLFFPGNAISLIRPEFCQRHGYCNSSGFAFYRQESHCFWNKEYSFFFFFFSTALLLFFSLFFVCLCSQPLWFCRSICLQLGDILIWTGALDAPIDCHDGSSSKQFQGPLQSEWINSAHMWG